MAIVPREGGYLEERGLSKVPRYQGAESSGVNTPLVQRKAFAKVTSCLDNYTTTRPSYPSSVWKHHVHSKATMLSNSRAEGMATRTFRKLICPEPEPTTTPVTASLPLSTIYNACR